MTDKVCTRFIDDDGLDIGCHLISKRYLLENYPHLVPSIKAPALWVWGDGTNGELGTNSSVVSSSPVQTISGGTNWKQVSGSDFTKAGIKTDGTLWLWGYGGYGIMGNDSLIPRSSPVQTISGGTDWKQVSLGGKVGAIKTDGTLWTWGYNYYGYLGTNDIINRSSPVQTVSGGTDWKSVSAGGAVAAIKTDGTLWIWGRNVFGALGTGNITSQSSPVQTVSGGTDWKSVSTGGSSTGAIKTDGTLWLWGSGAFGILGNNSTVDRSSPVQTISGGNNWKQVAIGSTMTSAIKTDGTLWTWGQGSNGRLGNNSIINRSSPVQTVSGGMNWFKVVVATSSSSESAAGIKTDGTLWVWGRNHFGQLGTEDLINYSSPVQTISGGTGWKDVSMAIRSTMAIKDEDDL